MSKKANDELRAKYVEALSKALTDLGEEVLRVGTGELSIPVVDSEGNDSYVVFTVKIPTGSRDGDAYDAYSMAEDYTMRQANKAEKAAKAAKEKAAKIARDEKMRAQKAAAKAAHNS